MDIWAYLAQREKELRGLSVHSPDIKVAEEVGSNGQRGRLVARASLNDEAFVEVNELVRVQSGKITPEKYAYFLCINGQEIGGYERDPTHEPAEHKHCSDREGHERIPAPTVSFRRAVEEAWDYVSGLHEDDPSVGDD